MWSDAFLAERRRGVFNYDKNENGENNNDKDDKYEKDVNNNNKVDFWAGALSCIGDWGWIRVPYPVVLLHLKDIDNNVKSNVDSDDSSNEE